MGKPDPRPEKPTPEPKPPRVARYLCADHGNKAGYVAGCPACRAVARQYARDARNHPVFGERIRDRKRAEVRPGEARRGSPESRARGRESGKRRAQKIAALATRRYAEWTEEDFALVESAMPARAVALILGRTINGIDQMRHRLRINPGYRPGRRGTGRWTPHEDVLALAGMSNKYSALLIGRTYEATKFRRSYLRRMVDPDWYTRAAS
jgi:hypothetical protein